MVKIISSFKPYCSIIAAWVNKPALIGIINKGSNGESEFDANSIDLGILFLKMIVISKRTMPMIELGTGMAIQDWIASPRTRKTKRAKSPTSIFPFFCLVRKERLELSHLTALEPKSSVSTNSTTSA